MRYAPLNVIGLSLALALAAIAAPDEDTQTLFEGGSGGYSFYRIPAVIRTADGTLLAFAQGRREKSDFTDADIVLRRSLDHGATWSGLQVLVDNGPHVARNPAPVFDPVTGKVVLIYCTNSTAEKQIVAGIGSVSVWSMTSDDAGITWSDPVEITSSVRPPNWRHYAVTPGHGIATRSGRLLFVGNHSAEGVPGYAAHSFYSDDHGITWQLGGTVNFPNANENQAAELADGTVVMNFRIQDRSSGRRGRVTSSDGGRTWNDDAVEDPNLPDPVCQGSLLAYTPEQLLFCNAASNTERINLTLRLSTDGGRTWSHSRLISPGFSAYSDLVRQEDGRIGILWEADQYTKIRYTRVTLEWLISPE